MIEQGTLPEQGMGTGSGERRKDAHNLRDQSAEQAKYRWSQNLPVRVPAFAAAIGVSYAVARRFIKSAGFPLVEGYVCREEYEAWRRRMVEERMAAADGAAKGRPSAGGRPGRSVGKSGGLSRKRGSRVSSPRRAERLRAASA